MAVNLVTYEKLFDSVSTSAFNRLNAELNPICYLLALLELIIFSTLSG